MGVQYNQGPIYFHAVQNKKYRDNYDDIFRKKEPKAPASKQPAKAKETTDTPTVDNT